MFNKLYLFTQKANQIIFFIVAVIFIVFISSVLLEELFRDKYEVPKVEIIQKKNTLKEISFKKRYAGLLNGFHVFRITADSIYDTDQDNNGMLNMFSGSIGGQKTVNLMFIDEDGSKRFLFKNHQLISGMTLSGENGFNSYGDSNVFTDRESSLAKNIYSVINTDSNKDGFYSEDDTKTLYYSDFSGLNLKAILDDFNDYSIINVDKILVEKFNAGVAEFYIFNLTTGLLNKLNTDIDL